MGRSADAMIASLTSYDDVDAGTVEETDGTSTFDAPDTTLDEIPEVTAVPPGVIDEQQEVFEQASQETSQEEPAARADTEPGDDSVEYWKRAAEGRRAEITSLRNKLGETSQNIEELRKMWLAEAQERANKKAEADRLAELEKEKELYGEDVVNDPSVRYMRDKVQQTQEMIERARQNQEARERVIYEQQEQARREQVAQQQSMESLRDMESELAEQHPDYHQAYDWAVAKRASMYQARGYSEQEAQQAVMNEEAFLFAEQMQKGGNPAKVAYDLAVEWGWKPEMAQPAEQTAQTPPVDVSKIKAGIEGGGVKKFGGQAATGGEGSDVISAEQFFKTVPDSVRLKVLADPDKFEELGRTGKIKVTW